MKTRTVLVRRDADDSRTAVQVTLTPDAQFGFAATVGETLLGYACPTGPTPASPWRSRRPEGGWNNTGGGLTSALRMLVVSAGQSLTR